MNYPVISVSYLHGQTLKAKEVSQQKQNGRKPKPRSSATTAADATSTTTTNLNDLSQDILLHILSFLPTLESITTSLISKNGNLSEFVDRTLILRPHLPLQKFRLEFIYEDRYGCHVDSWVRYAIRNRVSELDLDFFIDESFHIVESEGRRDYDFPFSDVKCDLTLPADMESMNLWSMKEIFFYQIYMTDDMVLNLLKACPNIEVLKLENCYGMENLRLCSEKLKRLGLSSFYTAKRELYLELDCPNLVWLTMILDPLYKIDDDESLSEELLNKPIHFSIPSLKEVKLKVIPGENQNQIVQFVALLKKQGVVLDKIVLVPLYSGISVSRAEVNE
uniref:F-box domain-containing protein n=1 Tax=Salix viminalis TaxID=40686 RepID=A0A6N2M302_SALVM